MEIIIAVLLFAGIGYLVYKQFDKTKDDGSHPLDVLAKPRPEEPVAPYKIETPVTTTVVDGIGHESVEVTPKKKPAAKPKKAVAAKPKKTVAAKPKKEKAVEVKPKKTKKSQ